MANFSHFHPSTIEDFAQIFELADIIFKEKSSTINIRKGMFLIYVQKHSFSNIACKLWKLKFPEAC